jgi:hypothetical protein
MAQSGRSDATTLTNRFSRRDHNPRVTLISLGIGLVAFLVTEGMHYLLVPDIGRYGERLLAEGVSAFVVALLAAKLMHAESQRRQAALLRMQVISEMNHHIRNALAVVTLTTDSLQNEQSIRVISESVDRIEWALREILLRPKPLPEKEQDRLRYFHSQNISTPVTEEHTNEHRKSSLR